MNKSLRWKFVLVMLVLIVTLMTVVSVILIQGVQRFYTNEFLRQMETAFSDRQLYTALQGALDAPEPVESLQDIVDAYQLGINGHTRNYYILGPTGQVLGSSAGDAEAAVEITPNILSALTGQSVFLAGANASFMDVAVPVFNESGDTAYVVYVRDNKQTVHDLNKELITIIVEAVVVGIVISAALSFIVSKTLLQPIVGMTRAAEAMADGDFSKQIAVESDDEVGIMAETFNNMAYQLKTTLEEIKKSEALRREFVANVSHELRTPLTSIRSYAETLTGHADIPKAQENDFLHVILNESDRMTKIVQDLLELSRFDAGNSKFVIERFDLTAAINAVNDAVALESLKHNHTVTLEFDEDLPMIMGDKGRIEQVLMNVLSNAVKYTPDGGRITIASEPYGDAVRVTIRDTGIGIPEEDLVRIFDRFYRVDKARSRASGGTGLGLSIAREIIVRHGGDIKIDSVAGKGTTVTIDLPIEGPEDEQPS